MWLVVFCVFFLGFAESLLENDILDKNEVKIEHFVYWPNGTIPFYIHPEHFDHEQSSIILTSLTSFAYKTCLKFLPALVEPTSDQHVLVIVNPNGVRQCVVSTTGHARDEPHYLVLGYECLHSPNIDMMLMKALGFGFEHNRAIRELYIRVQKENINPSAMDLFVMDDKLPTELRALPYDMNSVMHFGEREYSKNGHRTILFLDHKVKPYRDGLSGTDLRKIDIVYGPECRKRDRLEKIDLCQGYPGVARKKRSVDDDDSVREIEHTDDVVREKRDVEPPASRSLRVNPNITPPPELLNATEQPKDLNLIMEELGIKDAVEEITNLVYKLGARALTNVRLKHCNVTNTTAVEPKTESGRRSEEKKPDIFGVVEMVAEYVQDMVDHALTNLTAFCEVENDLGAYQRQRCNWANQERCPVVYKSTKTGAVMYSTKNRPYIPQSTKHYGNNGRIVLYHQGHRRHGDPDDTDTDTRRKREAETGDSKKKVERRFEGRRYNVRNPTDGIKWDQSDVSMEHLSRKHGGAERDNDENEGEEKRAQLPKTVELSKKNLEFYGERMWPDGFVRYVITEDKKYDLVDLRRRLAAVARILQEKTCVSLEEITEEDAERFEDYLVLDGSADYITGKVGGRQNFGSLELFEGGQHKQHAAMMVMAMLGFYFELARHDRDAHVRVHLRHVRPDKLHHFEKIRSDATLPLPYDYESATHPAWQFWRQIGKTGISTVATYKEKDPDGSIMRSLGQHDHLLSPTDIIKINSVYGTKCFEKKNQERIDDDNESMIKEIDLTEKQQDEFDKPKNEHELETWNRHKYEQKKREERQKHGGERHKHEEERHKDDENHGRNRHRQKQPRDKDSDDEKRHRERERYRDRNRNEREKDNRMEREQSQERGKRNRDKSERERGNRMVRDKYTEDRDTRDKQDRYQDRNRKRPRESEEDREEQERIHGNNGQVERGRLRHKDYESERHRERYRERDRGRGRHGRYQNRAERARHYKSEDKRLDREEDIDRDDVGSEAEEAGGYRQRNSDNAEGYSDENVQDEREQAPDNNQDYAQPLAYQGEIRRGQVTPLRSHT